MTLFASTLHGLGLSHSDAADFLGVRLDTVKNWSSGRRAVPDGVFAALHKLARRQIRAAEAIAKNAENAAIELEIASDDAEAKEIGWPCVGAQMAAFRRAWEMLGPNVKMTIRRRGNTS